MPPEYSEIICGHSKYIIEHGKRTPEHDTYHPLYDKISLDMISFPGYGTGIQGQLCKSISTWLVRHLTCHRIHLSWDTFTMPLGHLPCPGRFVTCYMGLLSWATCRMSMDTVTITWGHLPCPILLTCRMRLSACPWEVVTC
jgi:hypothetical protein